MRPWRSYSQPDSSRRTSSWWRQWEQEEQQEEQQQKLGPGRDQAGDRTDTMVALPLPLTGGDPYKNTNRILFSNSQYIYVHSLIRRSDHGQGCQSGQCWTPEGA